VHHVGEFPQLEDEMTSYTQEEAGQWSPNRLDALVWAITELGLSEWREARISSPVGRTL
jgi:phage terminase large subunit-like protein